MIEKEQILDYLQHYYYFSFNLGLEAEDAEFVARNWSGISRKFSQERNNALLKELLHSVYELDESDEAMYLSILLTLTLKPVRAFKDD